ncbi:uncharacterized protein AB675_2316 [Cyphellophora attinorum]|uniref:ATP synthase F(0) complex subunit e, mitochondrial n=1 Tax=Cyphellophora attinorum TaxID=1664694 RepID=A0A0N0NRB9_9EURO|nr:uncharacterized protein AB675_2316 [Phialophora attinorum]KPI44911.1 hypothetical protein AB675_2316 [Phialophora attinorum]
MATSQGVNVLRYSALVFGVFYGFTHQRTLTASAKAAHEKEEYDHKEALIQRAKAAWAEKQNPLPRLGDDGGVTDPDNSKFDLGALLDKMDADSRKAGA